MNSNSSRRAASQTNSDEHSSLSGRVRERRPSGISLSSTSLHLKAHKFGGIPAPDGKTKRMIVGICAMKKKAESKAMRELSQRFKTLYGIQVVVFPEHSILHEPVETWPRCHCLIAFFSSGFPLEKAELYHAKFGPFLVNDLRPQHWLKDRRHVYRLLQKFKVPVPEHEVITRSLYSPSDPNGGINNSGFQFEIDDEAALEEFQDYIVLKGKKIMKPFVEKPIDADDHNVYIYFPRSEGGGSVRLFRKKDNKSSEYFPDVCNVRRNGSYIYEKFLTTEGTDVKVYAVTGGYAHAEARKSPHVDGVVHRGKDGGETRYPVVLNRFEKKIAFQVSVIFRQNVCGFDLLRSRGKSYVCDVNGWSFVKKNKHYYDDAASILAKLMYTNMGLKSISKRLLNPEYPPAPVSARSDAAEATEVDEKDLSAKLKIGSYLGNLALNDSRPGFAFGRAGLSARSASESSNESLISFSGGMASPSPQQYEDSDTIAVGEKLTMTSNRPSLSAIQGARDNKRTQNKEELRCVVAVIRHGDRTPKQKMKIKIGLDNTHIFALFHKHFIAPVTFSPETASVKSDEEHTGERELEVKLKTSKDLNEMIETAAERIRVLESRIELLIGPVNDHEHDNADSEDHHVDHMVETNHDIETITRFRAEIDQMNQIKTILEREGSIKGINRKLQLKVAEHHIDDQGKIVVTKILLVLKWGGVLTELGRNQAEMMGKNFRENLYPNDGLLRLHATFRHNLKIFSSEEGRVQQTAAAFAKGLLNLHGHLTPIMTSLVYKNKHINTMLDDCSLAKKAGDEVKQRLQKLIEMDPKILGSPESNDGPGLKKKVYESVTDKYLALLNPTKTLSVSNSVKQLGGVPKDALRELYDAIVGLVISLSEVLEQFKAFDDVNKRDLNIPPPAQQIQDVPQHTVVQFTLDDDQKDKKPGKREIKKLKALEKQLEQNALGRTDQGSVRSKSPTAGNGDHDSGTGSRAGSHSAGASLYNNSSPPQKTSLLSSTQMLLIGRSRWKRLRSDFYSPEKNKFNLSKIPDIFDCAKYDIVHSPALLTLARFNGSEVGAKLVQPMSTIGSELNVDPEKYTESCGHYLREVFRLSHLLATIMVPQEYGITPDEKFNLGRAISHRLLTKIRRDLRKAIDHSKEAKARNYGLPLSTELQAHSVASSLLAMNNMANMDRERHFAHLQTLIEDENESFQGMDQLKPLPPTSLADLPNVDAELDMEYLNDFDETSHQVDWNYVAGAQADEAESRKHVRTRLYFTSESHMHSLLNAIRWCTVLKQSAQTSSNDNLRLSRFESTIPSESRRKLSELDELSYLTHIVFRLYEIFGSNDENTSVASASTEEIPRRFKLSIYLSKGCPVKSVDVGEDSASQSSSQSDDEAYIAQDVIDSESHDTELLTTEFQCSPCEPMIPLWTDYECAEFDELLDLILKQPI